MSPVNPAARLRCTPLLFGQKLFSINNKTSYSFFSCFLFSSNVPLSGIRVSVYCSWTERESFEIWSRSHRKMKASFKRNEQNWAVLGASNWKYCNWIESLYSAQLSINLSQFLKFRKFINFSEMFRWHEWICDACWLLYIIMTLFGRHCLKKWLLCVKY